MKALHRFSIRHPVLVVTLGAIVTLAIAPGVLKLELRTDGHALVPPKAPAVLVDATVRDQFNVRDPIVVLVRPRDSAGVFNARTLHLVDDLTRACLRVPGLDSAHVRSLATETGDRFRPGTLVHRRLLEPVPETPAQMEELRGDIEAIRLLTGTLVSFDSRATALLLGVPGEADRATTIAAIRDMVARADTTGHDVQLIGAPVAEALLGAHILEDLGVSRVTGGRLADRPDAGLGLLARLRLGVARHLGLLPLAVLVMALVFVLAFRSVAATLLPLAEAGACLVVVFGLMGWLHVPVYLTMAVLPVILVSMGLADEIHVFTCYRQHLDRMPGAPIREVVGAALDEMSLPVTATAATTAVGFLSFAISPLEPVKAFGIFTAIGIVFCLVWTLTVIPALLVLLAPGRIAAPGAAAAAGTRRAGGWIALASRIGRHPWPTLALATLALAVTPLGVRRLVVQDSWISGFAPESEFYRATQYFNREFFGAHRLLLALDTGHVDVHGTLMSRDITVDRLRLPGTLGADPDRLVGCRIEVSRPLRAQHAPSPFAYSVNSWTSTVETATPKDGRVEVTTPPVHGSPLFLMNPLPRETLDVRLSSQRLALPAVLQSVEDLERFVGGERRYTVGGVLGPADHVTTAEFLLEGRNPEYRSIPSDPDRVRWLWDTIEQVQGPARRLEVVDPEFRRGLVTVFLKNANYRDTARLMGAIRDYERQHLTPQHIGLEFAGDVAVSQALIEGIVRSQIGSLLLSLLGILIVIAVLFRSLRWGTLCMIPAGLSVAATFAVMGWTSMPLGVATSMFAGMVLGIGVDFAIHMAERFRLGLRRGAGRDEAILDALVATGPAILINGLAVALGFGILVLSRVPANAQLGVITVVSLVTCLAATLLVMPAVLRVAGGGKRPVA